MNTRTRDNSTVSTFVEPARLIQDGVRYDDPTSYVVVKQLDVMIDSVTPDFKRRSNTGEIIINPMEKFTTNTTSTYGTIWVQWSGSETHLPKSARWSRDGQVISFAETWRDVRVVGKVERAEALAVTSAYAKVGSPDVATLTELAEIRETIQFLMSPVSAMKAAALRLRSYLRALERYGESFRKRLARWESLPAWKKKRVPKPSWDPPKFRWGRIEVNDIASAWLAFRYAIMPLIYTFEDIQKHLAREEFPERATARAKHVESVEFVDTGPPSRGTIGSGVWSKHASVETVCSITSRAGVLYAPDWSLSSQLGVQLNRIPMALYEVIPLSFVTDWFHNGAEYYDALTAEFRANKIYGAWVTTELKSTQKYFRWGTTTDPRVTTHGRVHLATCVTTWKRRRRVALSDVQFFLRTELNAKRLADALALIKTILLTSKK